METATLYISL